MSLIVNMFTVDYNRIVSKLSKYPKSLEFAMFLYYVLNRKFK